MDYKLWKILKKYKIEGKDCKVKWIFELYREGVDFIFDGDGRNIEGV